MLSLSVWYAQQMCSRSLFDLDHTLAFAILGDGSLDLLVRVHKAPPLLSVAVLCSMPCRSRAAEPGWSTRPILRIHRAPRQESTARIESKASVRPTEKRPQQDALVKAQHCTSPQLETPFLCSSNTASGDWAQEGTTGVLNRSCGIESSTWGNIFPIQALGMYGQRFEHRTGSPQEVAA